MEPNGFPRAPPSPQPPGTRNGGGEGKLFGDHCPHRDPVDGQANHPVEDLADRGTAMNKAGCENLLRII